MSFSAAASTTVSAESNPDITNNNGNEDKSTTNSASTPSVQPDIVAAAEVTVNVEQSSIPIDAAENLSSEELAETESAVDDALAMLLSLGTVACSDFNVLYFLLSFLISCLISRGKSTECCGSDSSHSLEDADESES